MTSDAGLHTLRPGVLFGVASIEFANVRFVVINAAQALRAACSLL